MSTIPKFASNKKYWQILNKLVFGDEVSCPRCHKGLHENYCNKYLWRKLCRKKYRPTSYQASWLYGMKLSPRQLCSSYSTASKQNAQRKRHTY